jgi:hypothetical protein
MANWTELIAAINAVIKTNGNRAITGAILQNVLDTMVTNLGANRQYAGVATRRTNPGTPDGNVYYLANGGGTFTGFGELVVDARQLTLLYNTASGWGKLALNVPTAAESAKTRVLGATGYNWNLYDPATRSLNTKLDASGNPIESTIFDTSDYIPVSQGSYTAAPGAGMLRLYDAGKSYLSTIGTAVGNIAPFDRIQEFIIANPNAAFARLVVYQETADICVFSRRAVPMDYGISQYASPATEHNIANTVGLARVKIPFRLRTNSQTPVIDKNGNDYFPVDKSRDISDYINVTQLTDITITTKNGKLIAPCLFMYGADFSYLGMIGNNMGAVEQYTASLVGRNAAYVIALFRRPENLPNNVAGTYDVEITGTIKGSSIEVFKPNQQLTPYAMPFTIRNNEQPPTAAGYVPDPERDCTDYIPTAGVKSFKMTAGGDNVIGGISVYNAKATNRVTVGNYNNYVPEFVYTPEPGQNYFVAVTRRPGFPSNAAKFAIEATPVGTAVAIMENKQPPANGVYSTDPERDVTDYIPVLGKTLVTMKGNGKKVSCAFMFYESKQSVGVTVGNFANYANEFTAEVPENARYVVVVTRRPGMPNNADSISIEVVGTPTLMYFGNEVYDPAQDTNLIARIADKIDVQNVNLEGKKAAVFGSSNTTQYYGIWFQDLCDYFKMDYKIYGIGGATYPIVPGNNVWSGASGIAEEVLGQPNSMVTEVEYKLNNDPTFIPDVFMFNSGFNEAALKPPVGDLATVFTKTLDEIRNSTDSNFGINTLIGGMRWCLETLMINYPDAVFIGMIPFQASNVPTAYFIETLLQPMLETFGRLAIPVINCLYDGGFYSQFENAAPYKYTVDSIHVRLGTNINEKGRFVQNEFLKRNFLNVYYPKNNAQ